MIIDEYINLTSLRAMILYTKVKFHSALHLLHSSSTDANAVKVLYPQTLLSRRQNIQTKHFSFLKFNLIFLSRHILLIPGPNHHGDSLQSEPKVGQKSKISHRKPFVAPNQNQRALMRAFVGSGGLSGCVVTKLQTVLSG